MNKETCSNREEKQDFFVFSARSKAGGRRRSPVSGELEQVPVSAFNQAFESQSISGGGSFAAACMHLLPFLLGLVQGRAYWGFPF